MFKNIHKVADVGSKTSSMKLRFKEKPQSELNYCENSMLLTLSKGIASVTYSNIFNSIPYMRTIRRPAMRKLPLVTNEMEEAGITE